jgi:hypothetical protein
MKIAIAAAAAVVLALVVVGAFMLIDRPVAPETPSGNQTVKATSADTGSAEARALRMHRRPPRINDPRLLRTPADRRLAVPEPIRRPDFHRPNADKDQVAEPKPDTTMDPTKRRNLTSVPPDFTIARAKALTKEGRVEDAKKLLRNSILVERNPLIRKRLEAELGFLANPDGAKSVPATQGQVK